MCDESVTVIPINPLAKVSALLEKAILQVETMCKTITLVLPMETQVEDLSLPTSCLYLEKVPVIETQLWCEV